MTTTKNNAAMTFWTALGWIYVGWAWAKVGKLTKAMSRGSRSPTWKCAIGSGMKNVDIRPATGVAKTRYVAWSIPYPRTRALASRSNTLHYHSGKSDLKVCRTGLDKGMSGKPRSERPSIEDWPDEVEGSKPSVIRASTTSRSATIRLLVASKFDIIMVTCGVRWVRFSRRHKNILIKAFFRIVQHFHL